jgi:hypothetical protein
LTRLMGHAQAGPTWRFSNPLTGSDPRIRRMKHCRTSVGRPQTVEAVQELLAGLIKGMLGERPRVHKLTRRRVDLVWQRSSDRP